ncbi:MAG TPA: hypothetical protein VFI52_18105 [Gemmatimonadaceae bacterium]|nr:hypothetical protein [Gemmatimonadaceae bacterium]
MRRPLSLLALAGAVMAAPHEASAQMPESPGLMPEVRGDVILGRHAAVQLGVGVQIPAGYYVRVGVDGAVGVRIDESSLSTRHPLDGRLDVLARFLLDPFRQTSYGLSLGGGMSLRAEQGDRVRPVLLVAVDVEGRRSRRGLVPAMQVGLGGGTRIGVVLRRGAAGAR